MKHISLTIEESPESVGRRAHLHAQFTFDRRIDRTYLGDLLNKCCADTCVKGKKSRSASLALLFPVSLLSFALAGPTIAFHLAH